MDALHVLSHSIHSGHRNSTTLRYVGLVLERMGGTTSLDSGARR